MIFDKTVLIKQLTVVEAHGILLVRTDRGLFKIFFFSFKIFNCWLNELNYFFLGRDSRMHVFRLSSFESDACGSEPAALSRQNLKDQRLERTKGTHLYAVSRLGGSHLRVAVAVGKKLLLLQWRHSAAWTAWCPTSDTDTVEGFQYLRVSCVLVASSRFVSSDSIPCYQLTSRGEGERGGRRINQSIVVSSSNFVFSFHFPLSAPIFRAKGVSIERVAFGGDAHRFGRLFLCRWPRRQPNLRRIPPPVRPD